MWPIIGQCYLNYFVPLQVIEVTSILYSYRTVIMRKAIVGGGGGRR